MTDIELWLKQDGKIEQITDHEAFSEKIKKREYTGYNVVILRGESIVVYNIYWTNASGGYFEYRAFMGKIAQLEKAISVGRLLRACV